MTQGEKTTHHVVCYGCKYAPIELLAGFGASTTLMLDEPADFSVTESLAHGNLCGYGKAILAYAQRPDVHEMVLTSCCDVMRRVYDVLKAQACLDFLWIVDLPHRSSKAECTLLRHSLAKLADAYGAYSGRSFDVGRALAALAPGEPVRPKSIAVVGAHAGTSLLNELRSDLSAPVVNHTCTGPRVLAEPPASLARAEATGCGSCDVPSQDAPSGLDGFLDWYSEALLDQTPCMRMLDVGGRGGLVSTAQAGVVYHTMKFCDYYGFEYTGLAGDSEVPLLKIETDGTPTSAGQLRTRIEAFDETLRSSGRISESLKAGSSNQAPVRNGDADPDAAGSSGRSASAGGRYVLGLDSGSTSTDAVLLDLNGTLVASEIVATGAKASAGARRAIAAVLEKAGATKEDVALSVATGYGREAVDGMDRTITEISCHAAGAHHLVPNARTVIDIGGQDSKVIHLSDTGAVDNFVMNDKCAAGTGRFLEMMARTLEMPLPEFSKLGLTWKHDVRISSMCTVFAESEVVSLVADDTPAPDIIHGLDVSVATKTAALAKRVGGEPPYLMTGGVAHNVGVVRALESVLGAKVATSEDSQLCGAIGAAVLGLADLRRDTSRG